MADQTSANIDIAAKPDDVMGVIADERTIIDSALKGLKKRVKG